MIYNIRCHASWNIKSLYYKVPSHFTKPFGSQCTMNHYCTGRMIWTFAPGRAPVTKINKIKWYVRFVPLWNKQNDTSLTVEDERHYSIIVLNEPFLILGSKERDMFTAVTTTGYVK